MGGDTGARHEKEADVKKGEKTVTVFSQAPQELRLQNSRDKLKVFMGKKPKNYCILNGKRGKNGGDPLKW